MAPPTQKQASRRYLEDLIPHLERKQDPLDRGFKAVITQISHELISERDQVSQQISPAKTEVAPISSIPIEILQEIFLFANQPCYDGENLWWRWRVELVCHKWRKAALGCAELWSYISYVCDEDSLRLAKNPIKMVETCLKRSRNHPLDIYFEEWYHHPHSTPLEYTSIFKALLVHCHRWRRVTLDIAGFDLIEELDLHSGQFLTLESLSLSRFPDDPRRSVISLNALCDAPKLSTATLPLLNPLQRIHLPSRHITSLTVYTAAVLRDLTLPNIQSLVHYESDHTGRGDFSLSHINSFLWRSGCTRLTKLDIRPWHFTREEITETLRLVPRLEEFAFTVHWYLGVDQGRGFLVDILSELGASRAQIKPSLPRLRQLSVTARSDYITGRACARALYALKGRVLKGNTLGIAKLERFRWRIGVVREPMYERLKPLRDAGLAISFYDEEAGAHIDYDNMVPRLQSSNNSDDNPDGWTGSEDDHDHDV